MGDIIGTLVDQVFSMVFSQSIDKGKEATEQWKRKQQAHRSLLTILEAEKENPYYDSLMRMIAESCIIQDSFKRCETGQSGFDLSERLKSAFDQMKIPIAEKNAITGVIARMLKTLSMIMLEPASSEEARISARTEAIMAGVHGADARLERIEHALSNKGTSILRLADIEAYSEPARDTSHLIARKWVCNDDSNEEAGIESPLTLLQRERRIVLVNHAGFGKTMALHQLYTESRSAGKCAVLLSLSRSARSPLFQEMLSKDISEPEQVVFILDGYDEVKTEFRGQLDDAVNRIAERYPQMAIVVSSRENFLDEQRLRQFSRYRLVRLTKQEQQQYAQRQGIEVEPFMKQLRDKNLTAISENAFYFVELIHLWQHNGELPDEARIMERIVEGRIRADREKFTFSAPELEQREASLRRSLERIAMVMQCIQRYSLTEEEVQRICQRELCRQLNLHGLWETEDVNQQQFPHNNFRENFAACWLNRHSLEEILWCISWRTGKKKVKPSWMNVLAYLAKLRVNRDLQDWIVQHDPEVVFLFEKERFSDQERFDLFKRMYDAFEENQLWASANYQFLRRMGAFASSKETVDYILAKLSADIEQRQKQNLLRIMECFDSLYAEQNECRRIVSSIAFDRGLPECVRYDALDVMRAFSHVFSEYVPTAVRLCMDSAEEGYRYHLYRFIDAAGQLEQNFQVILHELELPEKEKGAFDAGRCIYLEKRIATLQSPQAVADLMALFAGHPKQLGPRMIKINWGHLFDVAISNHERMHDCFLPLTEQLLFAAFKTFSFGAIDEIKRYMIATHTEKAFLDFIREHDEIHDWLAIEKLMCPSFCDVLVSYYEEGRLNDTELLKSLVYQRLEEDDICRKLQRAILFKTGEIVTASQYRTNEILRAKGKQRCFDALFSRSDFLALMKELGESVGMDTPLKTAVFEILRQAHDEKSALEDCGWILYRAFRSNQETPISEAIEKIQGWDWDWFQYHAVSDKIGKGSEIKLSASQREWMEAYTRLQLENIDLKKVAALWMEKHHYNSKVNFVLSTMAKLDMDCSEEFLKSLLLVPAFLMDENNIYTFPQYLIDHIPQPDMAKQVLDNIQQEDLRDCIAAAHLHYCAEHKLRGAKSFAIRFLCREDGKAYRYCALHYISEVYGAEAIVDEVVPLCEDDDFLRKVIRYIPGEMKAPVLDEKLDAAYERNPSREWMEILVQRSHRNALEQYLREAEEKNGIPDMVTGDEIPSLTEAIGSVSDTALLDIILKLLYLSTKPGFVDRESFGLRHSCWKSVRCMARARYDEVRNALEQEKGSASGEYKLTCIDLIQQIDDEHQTQDDKGMSFEEALVFVGT